jgi:double-stranded uracil-DNA glycosylase
LTSPSDQAQGKPVLHGLPPLLDANTRLVVLGSFPGVSSLRAQQYYGHPQNQFWKIMATLLSPNAAEVLAMPYAERAQWLLAQGVGLWDVYAACDREGSLDSHIKNAQPNDLQSLRKRCPAMVAIAHNGAESFKHAKFSQALGVPVHRLPSTSPANASWSFDRKLEAWKSILKLADPLLLK